MLVKKRNSEVAALFLEVVNIRSSTRVRSCISRIHSDSPHHPKTKIPSRTSSSHGSRNQQVMIRASLTVTNKSQRHHTSTMVATMMMTMMTSHAKDYGLRSRQLVSRRALSLTVSKADCDPLRAPGAALGDETALVCRRLEA